MWTVSIIGTIWLLNYVITFLYNVITLCCRCKQDLYKKYGTKDGQSWAVVTGGSDGIGLEMSNQLAGYGFNVCIVSRNLEKIEQKIAELRQSHPNTQFKAVKADISKMNTMDAYNELVQRELVDLDLGVVCLNAGTACEGPVDCVSDSDFEGIFALNGLGVVYFAKALLPQMMRRKQRSSMLITSSIASYCAIPTNASYSASKVMVSNFAKALHYEVKEKIDVVGWEAGGVKTKIFSEAAVDKAKD